MKKFLLLLLALVMALGCLITVSAKEETTIAVLEDSYVMNADYEKNSMADVNYGTEKELHLKTDSDVLTRYTYLKFDISSLKGVTDFTCIDLELTLTVRQVDAKAPLAAVEVYAAPTDWSESNITFGNRPEELDLITVNAGITAGKVVNTFSITDYIRQALAAGKNTIALYLVENTPDFHLHTRFASKENGDPEKAPKLRVYYGTKTDTQVYKGALEEGGQESVPPQSGTTGNTSIEKVIAVLADTYVMNADYEKNSMADVNYGTEKELHLKTSNDVLTRYTYLKFDISSLKDVTDFSCIDLELTLTVRQTDAKAPLAAVEVYGAPSDWNESELTFDNRPEELDLITVNANITEGKVVNTFSITDYVRQALAAGKKTIALYLVENTPNFHLHTRFASKENGDPEKAPKLRVYYGGKTDTQVYRGALEEGGMGDVPPQDGTTVDPFDGKIISVLEDTYVINADYEGNNLSNNNYGADTEIHLRTGGESLTRYGYLKFDISSLEGATDFTCIDLELTLTVRQTSAEAPSAAVEVYGAPIDWNETELTFSNRPEELDLITINSGITADKVANAFSITDYVRQALAADKKTIALYLVENTPNFHLHTRFASKENGDPEKAPKLRVYYEGKTDTQVYDGAIEGVTYVYVPSQSGIDSFLGGVTKIYNIAANEDTYLQGGDYSGTNYGASEVLEFKHLDEDSMYHRVILLKFDFSEFEAKKLSRAEILLNCNLSEQGELPRDMKVYSCDPYAWDEMTVTLNTAPEKEELVASLSTGAEGLLRIDVTDYMKKALGNGEKVVAFLLEGTPETALRMTFDSRETKKGDVPTLKIVEGERGFATYMKYKGANPWDVAAERVNTWLRRWEEIKARGDMETDIVVKNESEYSLTVGATTPGKSNGYETQYTPFATRIISTLKGYDASVSVAKTYTYDVYGGLMDESLKQEATGFFYTKKIGDRWWTIDPLGYPYYKTGVVQITHGSSPAQQALTLSKHKTKEAWGEAATARLKELGFNSVGGWSDIDTLSKINEPLTQTKILDLLLTYAGEAGVTATRDNTSDYIDGVLPVFDPAFVDFAKDRTKSLTSAYNTKDYIYGWMSDNELPANLYMLDAALNLDTSLNSAFNYSYATAWTFMYLKTGKANVTMADVTDELRREYRAMVLDRYFEVVCDTLERYAPCQQYMGSRFVADCYKDEYIMRVAGHWCDVISINYYSAWEGDPVLMSNMEKWASKPFVVTEWYAKGMDAWEKDNRMTNRSGAGWTVKNQDDRGKFYQNYALMLMECKGCVGFDWFQYWDNDPDNLSADISNRNSNKGIYSNSYEEYTALTKYMNELNNQKYNLVEFFDAR